MKCYHICFVMPSSPLMSSPIHTQFVLIIHFSWTKGKFRKHDILLPLNNCVYFLRGTVYKPQYNHQIHEINARTLFKFCQFFQLCVCDSQKGTCCTYEHFFPSCTVAFLICMSHLFYRIYLSLRYISTYFWQKYCRRDVFSVTCQETHCIDLVLTMWLTLISWLN